MADVAAAGAVHEFAEDIAAPAPRSVGPTVLTIDDVFAQDSDEWLVEDVMPVDGLGLISGKPSTCKTFFMLGVAIAVALGRPWFGHATRGGPVLYVYAEGRRGLRKRIAAWCRHFDVDPATLRGRFFAVAAPVDVRDPTSLHAVRDQIQALSITPVLIVIDTLARCMGDGDENDARDMGQFVLGCDALRVTSSAAVWIVHHTRKNDNSPRGSSALEGAIDTHIQLQRQGATVTAECRKQKDAAEFEGFKLRLQVVQLDEDAKGKPVSSCVLVSVPVGTGTESRDSAAGTAHVPTLRAIWDTGGTTGCTRAQARPQSGCSRSAFYRSVTALIADDFVQVVDGSKPELLRATEAGQQLLVPAVPNRPNSAAEEEGKVRPKSQSPRPPKGRRSGTGAKAGRRGRRTAAKRETAEAAQDA